MKTHKRLTAGLSLLVGAGLLLGIPTFSMGSSNCVGKPLSQTLNCVTGALTQAVAPSAPAPRDPAAAPTPLRSTPAASPRQTSDPTTTPPLHGTTPHGQGTVAVIDTNPDPTRPYTSSTTGNGEDIVVGRSRGEQNADGTYHGHITIAALFGNEILGVDTTPGQSRNGPLDAVQTGLLTPLCNGTGNQICLSAVTADSSTTGSGSTNHFSTAHATLGGANGIDVGAAESNGNISSDGTCQTSHGDSQVANANVGGQALASVAKSSTDSKACRGAAPTQTNTSSVIGLGGTGVPIPAPGCADGTADTVTGIPTVLPIVCNADDTNGSQAGAPYGVRDALDAFVLASGNAAAAKLLTAGSESRAVAPAETGAQCADGIDNDGDGVIDAADPGCHTDGNAGNPGSYNPGGTSETNAQCSDGKDNDGDGLIDAADPGCHTDGNANNPSSYNPGDNDETNSGSGNKGTNGGGSNPACSDGKDNDGDGLIDANDPGCHSDGNANNPASYDSTDTSEANGNNGVHAVNAVIKPECSDGADNDGDGVIDAADPGCHSDGNANNAASYNPNDNSELNGGATNAATSSLPFTGTDLVGMLIIAALLIASGLALREWPRRRSMRS